MPSFHDYRAGDPAGSTVYLFHHAGSSAAFYQPLAKLVSVVVDCRVLQSGQRGERYREPMATTMAELVDQVLPEVEREPRGAVLFGHSMGAGLAYETALRAGPAVRAVVVSAGQPPDLDATPFAGPFDDASLIREVDRHDPATGAQLRANPDLAELVMPAIRADFMLLSTYRPTGGRRLSCPLVCLAGRHDPAVTVEQARHWESATTGPFAFREFPGGHLFVESHWPELAELLTAHARGATGPTSPTG